MAETTDELVRIATRTLLADGAIGKADVTPGMLFLVDGTPFRALDGQEAEFASMVGAAWTAGHLVCVDHTDPATMGTLLRRIGTSDIHQEFVDLCGLRAADPSFEPWAEWCRLVLMRMLRGLGIDGFSVGSGG